MGTVWSSCRGVTNAKLIGTNGHPNYSQSEEVFEGNAHYISESQKSPLVLTTAGEATQPNGHATFYRSSGFSDEAVALNQHMKTLLEDLAPDEVSLLLYSNKIITQGEVDQIQRKVTKLEKNYLLVNLIKARGPGAFQCFVEILEATAQQHLATQLKNLLHQKNSAYDQHVFEKLRDGLKDIYLRSFRFVNPFSLPFTFDIEKTWVSLALLEDNSNATEDHAELLNRAFAKVKMLIIEGKPATGKTSLMRRLAYDWARGKNELAHFDLVMYAEFREVCEQQFNSIAQLVRSYLHFHISKGNGNKKLQIFTNNEKYWKRHNVLVLLDGYDESSLDNQCEELRHYLSRTIVVGELQFNIVLTSRPGYLSKYRGQDGRYVFADVLGFTTSEQKEKYVSNHFSTKTNKESTESIKTVHKLLQSNPSLDKLSETPLFLTFFCLLFEKIVDGTILELYCNIIWWMLDRHQKDFPDRDVPELFGFNQHSKADDKAEVIQNNYLQFGQFKLLGSMALQNIEKSTFSKKDLDDFRLKSIIQKVGLLRKDEVRNGFQRTTEFSFPHRTIQEFLAALVFFSTSEEKLSVNIAKKIFHDVIKTEMEEFEKFLWRIAVSDKLAVDSKVFFKRFTCLVVDFEVFISSLGMSLTQIGTTVAKCCNVTTLVFYSRSRSFMLTETIDLSEMEKLENFYFRNFESKYIRKISQGKKTEFAKRKGFILLPNNPICFHLELINFEYAKEFVESMQYLSKILPESKWKLRMVNVRSESSFINVNTREEKLSRFSFPAAFPDQNHDENQPPKIFTDEDLNDVLQPLFSAEELTVRSPTTIRSLSFEHFPELSVLHFSDFVFPEDARLSFKNCKSLQTLIFNKCIFDSNALKSITTEICRSSVRCLQVSFDFFRREHFAGLQNFLQNCDVIEELKVDCKNDDDDFWNKFEDEFSNILSNLAMQIKQLNRILLLGRRLQERNREAIENSGQAKGIDFKVEVEEEDSL